MRRKSEFMETIRAAIDGTVQGYMGLMARHLGETLLKIVEDSIKEAGVQESPESEVPEDDPGLDGDRVSMQEILEDPEDIRMK